MRPIVGFMASRLVTLATSFLATATPASLYSYAVDDHNRARGFRAMKQPCGVTTSRLDYFISYIWGVIHHWNQHNTQLRFILQQTCVHQLRCLTSAFNWQRWVWVRVVALCVSTRWLRKCHMTTHFLEKARMGKALTTAFHTTCPPQ